MPTNLAQISWEAGFVSPLLLENISTPVQAKVRITRLTRSFRIQEAMVSVFAGVINLRELFTNK
jgi:hypothetical protein